MKKEEENKSKTVYKTYEENALNLVEMVREGVGYGYFTKIASTTPFTIDEWSDFLHLSSRTFQRYKKEKRPFDTTHSEKIIEIGILYNKGLEIFGSKDKFDAWLFANNLALGGSTPKSLLDNSFGIRLVNDELTRIEHGVFA